MVSESQSTAATAVGRFSETPDRRLTDLEAFLRGWIADSGLPPVQLHEILDAIKVAVARTRTAHPERAVEVRVRIRGATIDVDVDDPESPRRLWPWGPRAGGKGSFAEWLSSVLSQQGLSQEAAARRIGVSLKTVNRWIRGETEPRFRELALICDSLGVSPFASPLE